MADPESFGTLARGWVDATNAQVARELGILQEAMLERVDRLASELASASHEELASVEGVQAYAESFLVDAGQLFEVLATRLDSGLEERLSELVSRTQDLGAEGLRTQLSVERWRHDAQHSLTCVAQYVAGYVQGGSVALGLLLEMPEGPIDRALITSIVRHRLMFAADRAELAATQWAEEMAAQLLQLTERLDNGAKEAPSSSGRRSEAAPESFDLFGASADAEASEAEKAGEPEDAPESEAERLERLLGVASGLGVKVKKVPAKPSHTWLDKMEKQLQAIADKRKKQEATLEARKERLAALLDFAGQIKIKVKKVPEKPSDTWLDKMQAKLVEMAKKKGVEPPATFGGERKPEPASPDAPDAAEPSKDGATSDLPPERQASPSKMSDEERRERIDTMLAKAEKAGLELGNVPETPSDEWVETTEERLEEALKKRRAKRKAAREKKKRERDARIERLKADAAEHELDLGPIPKFPTEDWLSRMEMKLASMRLPDEEEGSSDDRAARLEALLAEAEAKGVELGSVPPDPDNLWLTWAEGRIQDAAAADELIVAGEDPEEAVIERARVVFEEGTVQERVWFIEEGELSIGRARSNHVQIRDDPGVSRKHCTLFERDGAYFIRDHGSTKGTMVDDHLVVEELAIESGSRIVLGDTEMLFRA